MERLGGAKSVIGNREPVGAAVGRTAYVHGTATGPTNPGIHDIDAVAAIRLVGTFEPVPAAIPGGEHDARSGAGGYPVVFGEEPGCHDILADIMDGNQLPRAGQLSGGGGGRDWRAGWGSL